MGNEQSNEAASSTGRKTKSNPPNNSNAAEVAPMDSRGALSEETRRRLERQFGPVPPKVKKEKKKETKASMPLKAAKEIPDKNGNDLIDQTTALALDNPKGTKTASTPYNPLSDPKITDLVLLRAIRFVLYLDEKEWILVDQLVKEVLGKKGVSRLQKDESWDKFVREGLGSMLTGYKRGYAGEVPKWNNDTRGWEIKKFVGLMYWARKILKEKKPCEYSKDLFVNSLGLCSLTVVLIGCLLMVMLDSERSLLSGVDLGAVHRKSSIPAKDKGPLCHHLHH